MLVTVRGTYRDGKVVLKEMPQHLKQSDVLVVFLPPGENVAAQRPIYFGQFAGERQSTEEDFHCAEWRAGWGQRIRAAPGGHHGQTG